MCAESTLTIPTVGFSIPFALATAIPLIAFKTIASARTVAVVPVVVAMNTSLPKAGVITRPTVETPIGKV